MCQTRRPGHAGPVEVEGPQGVAGGAHGRERRVVEGWYVGEGQELQVHQPGDACDWLEKKSKILQLTIVTFTIDIFPNLLQIVNCKLLLLYVRMYIPGLVYTYIVTICNYGTYMYVPGLVRHCSKSIANR